MKKDFISAVIIGAAVIILGLCLKSGIDNFAFRDREVSVRGLSERNVDADYVTWPMSYSIAGNDLPGLYDRMKVNNDLVVNFLTANGIDSTEITVNPPSLYNAATNVYGGDRARYAYNFDVTITVSTDKVKKVRELITKMSEVIRQGVALNNHYINYQFTGLNDIKPEMIAEATQNARLAADQFAKDSGSRVGKIKTAYQGQFSIDSTDDSTPNVKKVRVVSTIVYYLED